MTFRHFQSIFRPLVDSAWVQHCALTGAAVNNRTTKDTWRREVMYAACRIRSTKDASPAGYKALLECFSVIDHAGDIPTIEGWSDPQNYRFRELVKDAWRVVRARRDPGRPFDAWLELELRNAGMFGHASSRREGYDDVMGHFGVLAGDQYWIGKTAEAPEVRMRWQIRRFMGDLDYLTKTPHGWSYARAIWKQASQLPHDMEDAPAELLAKVLQMLDTHIRKLCRDYDIRPRDLPSRGGTSHGFMAISEDGRHLHIGHALEGFQVARDSSALHS